MASSPGTYAPGFTEPVLIQRKTPKAGPPVRGWLAWEMGECIVHRFRDDDGLQLVVSHDSRYPTWDEIKFARYSLLPRDEWYALMLPPVTEYVDDRANPYVFQVSPAPPQTSPLQSPLAGHTTRDRARSTGLRAEREAQG